MTDIDMTPAPLKNLTGNTTLYTSAQVKPTIDDVDAWKTGDKPLVSPTLSGTFTVYNSGDTETETVSGTSIVRELGYKISWSGNYKWTADSAKKDPEKYSTTGFESNVTDQTAPAAGTNVSLEVGKKSANSTATVTQKAAKKGLEVSGTKVVVASGNDTSAANVSIAFQPRRYWGKVAKDLSTITASDITALSTTELNNSRGSIKTFASTSSSEYVVYCYKASLGELTGIIQDNATPVLGAFGHKAIDITNAAGATYSYYVYVSNNPGAFPAGAKLEFI